MVWIKLSRLKQKAVQLVKLGKTHHLSHHYIHGPGPRLLGNEFISTSQDGKMFLIIVDAHSKWPEVVTMASTTSQVTIEALFALFTRYGLPEQVVSDNGPQFTSLEFAHFMKSQGIKHILSAPYHPSSNGLAERFVQTFKRAMKAGGKDGVSLKHRLASFLFDYRNLPHATTNRPPSELFLHRKVRTRFDLLFPDLKSRVVSKQEDQKRQHDKHSRVRKLIPGEAVMIRDFRHRNKWIPGTVVNKSGPVSYRIRTDSGMVVRRHVDHVTKRLDPTTQPEPDSTNTDPDSDTGFDDYPALPIPPATPERQASAPDSPRYPQRERRPPDRYPQRERRPPDRLMSLIMEV